MTVETVLPETTFNEWRKTAKMMGLNVSEDSHEYWLFITHPTYPDRGCLHVRLTHDSDGMPNGVTLHCATRLETWREYTPAEALGFIGKASRAI